MVLQSIPDDLPPDNTLGMPGMLDAKSTTPIGLVARLGDRRGD